MKRGKDINPRTSVVIAFLFLPGLAFSTSVNSTQADIVSHQKNNPNIKSESDHDFRGTVKAPLIVSVLPSSSAEDELKREIENEDKKSRRDWIIVYATVSLAVITLFLAFYTGKLWFATVKMVSSTDDTAKRQLRAYLTVNIGTGIYQDRIVNLRFEAKPALINTGRTPAHNVRYKANAQILPIPLPADFSFPLSNEFTGGWVLGPQQNFILNACVDDFVSDNEVEDIKRNIGRALYIWGTVVYADVFKNNWETKFCQRLIWFKTQNGEIIQGYHDPRHNEAI